MPVTIDYVDQSTNAATYEWDFGNETTSEEQNPSATYTSFKQGTSGSVGTFITKLTVTSANGCKNTKVMNEALTISLPIASMSADNLLGCVPLSVNIQSSSTYVSDQDEIVSYQWLLNGEEVSTESQWSRIFENPTEEEKIELLITTGLGCTSKTNDIIKAGRTQEPNFAVKDKSVFCASETVEFEDLSSDKDEIDFIEWDFGDGTKSFVGELTHMYTDTGTFDVELTVFHNGCKTSILKEDVLTINGPIIDFDRINQCQNVMTAELSSDLVDATDFEWDFGDGSAKVSGGTTVTHTYAQEGTYEINLTASNSNFGCNTEVKKEITIIRSSAHLLASKDSSCVNGAVSFDPLASVNPGQFEHEGEVYLYQFNFGDGSDLEYSNDVVNHNYKSEGKYISELIIRDLNNCTDTARETIEVFDVKPNFEYHYDNGCIPAQYTFFDRTESEIPIVEWEWNFGDGTISNDQNPIHLIQNFGIYDVQLTSTNKIGCQRTITKSNELVLLEPEPVIKADDKLGCLNTAIVFEEASFSNITAYAWNFGDGTLSNESNPSHSYSNTGFYDVSLSITDNHGCVGTVVMDDFISIQDFPQADFSSDQTVSNCYPFKVEFTDLSVGESLAFWEWNFGDDGTSTKQDPQHIYTRPGLYDVQAIASTSNGCSDTITKKELIIVKGPYAEIMVKDTVCLNTDVEYTLVNMLNVESVLWDFGDGNISDEFSPSHQYQLDGYKYPTALLVNSGSFACNKYINDTLYVDEVKAMLEFGDGKGIGCEPYNLDLVNNSIFANSFIWKVNDEVISEEEDPSYEYTEAGLYETSLQAISLSGCKDSTKTNVLVHPLPTVEIIADTFICRGDELMLWAKGGELYKWNPDNSLDYPDIDIPIATPVNTTKYKVEVTDLNECINRDSVTITVQQPPYVLLTDSTIIIGESIQYDIADNGIKNYEWLPDTEISDANIANPLIMPTETRTYSVAVTDTADCFTETFSFDINVEKKYSVDVPTAFTPNGDNINDLIMVKGWGIKELKYFRVFDRYGAKVFETNDVNEGWDGKYKGVDQESGIYNYIVRVLSYDDKIRETKGAFELIK
jgi:gliding motility-associated-like protein